MLGEFRHRVHNSFEHAFLTASTLLFTLLTLLILALGIFISRTG